MTDARPASLRLIDTVLDDGTFARWDAPLEPPPGPAAYRDEWSAARRRSGVDEAVVTGEGQIHGRRVAVIVGEFAFLGGTIGIATAERIRQAIVRATAARLPVLASPVSGGTRMQEGTAAFVRMASIAQAVLAHKAAGLPYLVYLRHPTTGGVFASWGSMGHVTVAQPGALIGFLGPRVYEAIHGETFPEGVQTAENLHAHGIVDAVVSEQHLARLTDDVLAIMSAQANDSSPGRGSVHDEIEFAPVADDGDDWERVERSRRPSRPGVRSLLAKAEGHVVPLSGTGRGESDQSIVLALARFAGRGVVVIGQDRRSQATDAPLGPAALRTAMRGIALAEQLRLPIVTVIDTPGADLSVSAEEGGLAVEIGRCLGAMLSVPVATVSLIMGEGAGGAALALLPADHIMSVDDGWLAPLPPEGASAIIHRTPDRAPELARAQRIGSWHLKSDGIIDEVIATRHSTDYIPIVIDRITAALDRLGDTHEASRLHRRATRFDHNPGST